MTHMERKPLCRFICWQYGKTNQKKPQIGETIIFVYTLQSPRETGN